MRVDDSKPRKDLLRDCYQSHITNVCSLKRAWLFLGFENLQS